MMDDAMITIQTERFLELIKIETRVDILVDMIERDEFVTKEEILRIIGTEKAIKAADRIKGIMEDWEVQHENRD